MLMHTTAPLGYTDTVRQLALGGDSGRKILAAPGGDSGRKILAAPGGDSGRKILAAPGTRTRVNTAPGFSVGRSTITIRHPRLVKAIRLKLMRGRQQSVYTTKHYVSKEEVETTATFILQTGL